MTHILFAVQRHTYTQGGWWDQQMRGTLQECMAAGDGMRVDWAHIVEAATGDVVRAKVRNPDGSADAAGAWSENVGDRMPEIFSVMLPKEDRDKLAALGGEHWLRAQLAKTGVPPPLPNVGTAQELLRAVAARDFPVLVPGEQARLVEELRKGSLVEAEYRLEATPDGNLAVVLAITDKGYQALTQLDDSNAGPAGA